MTWLPDATLDHLRGIANVPDLSGTRYRALRALGQGGMGAVYLVEDTELGRDVALKVLHLEDRSGEAVQRLRREARTLARLEHPNIVPVYDAGRLPDGRVFYTMKYVQGRRLDEFRGQGTPLPEALRLLEKVCGAVAFAHSRGVIHRDLKPENIMVGPFGEVLVMDWGVACALASQAETLAAAGSSTVRDTRLTAHGTVVGTPAYMPPEQQAGDLSALSERSDVFALGAILFFLVTGRHPAHDASKPPPGFPRRLFSVFRKATEAKPAGRYGSAGEVAAEVGRYLDGLPVQVHRETLPERVGRFASRNRTPLLLIAAYLLVRFGLLLFSLRP